MARPTRRERPVRPLVTLSILVFGLAGALLAGTRWSDAALLPELALDLEGGTQLILRPISEAGVEPTGEAIAQAIDIIRQRVDASGVTEAEITSQGGENIVVGIPGEPDEATLDLVRESAQMEFRPVLLVAAPQPVEAEPTATPTPEATAGPGTEPPVEQEDGEAETETAAPQDVAPEETPPNASDVGWLTSGLLAEFDAYDCTDPANLRGGSTLLGDPDAATVACDASGLIKYVLGPVELRGERIAQASAGLEVLPSGAIGSEWVARVSFDSEGRATFSEVTQRLVSLESPRDQFAIVLDGLVVSAPQVRQAINDGNAEISGGFTREEAGTLARQLNFGALPLSFEVQSEEQISATLGSEQLQKGLLAGLIGLVLVGLYSLVQYRALGAVTITSLGVAGTLAYLTIAVLSWVQGYRLSLAGVAGLIVAIGITADSFIVYFERIRDELRDGRTLAAAVEHGWARARRTILASDAVSFLAAIVLYFIAVGGVRGFAFTLGLTTVIDLLVVFAFTHPVMTLLARRRFFAIGHNLSGLDPSLLGARPRYAGRGRVTGPGVPTDRGGAHPVAEPAVNVSAAGGARMTIAERKAAQRRAAELEGREGKDV